MLDTMIPRIPCARAFTVVVGMWFTVGCGPSADLAPEPETAYGGAREHQVVRPPIAETETPAQVEPTGPRAGPQVQTQEGDYDLAEDTDPSALVMFRQELEPYGRWADDPVYGVVWIPHSEVVGAEFVPYATAGHWGLTEDGDWIWVSDYPFGWVAFHYGRWVWIPGTGWAWIPGRSYAPAWVVWRVPEPGFVYVGWAPMPPAYYWSGGVAVSLWVVPPPAYVYCDSVYVFSPDVHRHLARGERARWAASGTRSYSEPGAPVRYAARPSRGPTPARAGVPASAVPSSPQRPDERSLAAARPRGSAVGMADAGVSRSSGVRDVASGGLAHPSRSGDPRRSATGTGSSAVSPRARPLPASDPAQSGPRNVPGARPERRVVDTVPGAASRRSWPTPGSIGPPATAWGGSGPTRSTPAAGQRALPSDAPSHASRSRPGTTQAPMRDSLRPSPSLRPHVGAGGVAPPASVRPPVPAPGVRPRGRVSPSGGRVGGRR